MPETIFKAEKIIKQYSKFNISKLKFRKITALKGLDMEIRRGDIYGFVGENGAGKTTLMRILAGLSTQTAGKIELFGEKRAEVMYRQRSRINGIIETPAVTPSLTARDNLEICRIQRGIADKGCISKALLTVGLKESEIDKVKVKDFSLGMKQRLSIAMALIGNAELLFFDEPFNGLDPVGIRNFGELVRRLNSERGITILISSHMLSELDQLATCYGFIHKGKMLEQISADDLKRKLNQYMVIKVSNAPEAERILQTAFGITKLKVQSGKVINLYEQFDKKSEIMRALLTEGINVDEMTVKKESLKKYYMSLIDSV